MRKDKELEASPTAADAPSRWRVESYKVVGPARVGVHVAVGDVICDQTFAEHLRSVGVMLKEIA